MSYNGWSNRETWIISVWFNPESAEDVDYARETIENEYENLPGYLQDFIDINAIDWDELKSAFQSEDDENDDY